MRRKRHQAPALPGRVSIMNVQPKWIFGPGTTEGHLRLLRDVFWWRGMNSVGRYLENSEDCLRWAKETKFEEQRKNFLGMARAWAEVANAESGMPADAESEFKAHAMKWPRRREVIKDYDRRTNQSRRQNSLEKLYATAD